MSGHGPGRVAYGGRKIRRAGIRAAGSIPAGIATLAPAPWTQPAQAEISNLAAFGMPSGHVLAA